MSVAFCVLKWYIFEFFSKNIVVAAGLLSTVQVIVRLCVSFTIIQCFPLLNVIYGLSVEKQSCIYTSLKQNSMEISCLQN